MATGRCWTCSAMRCSPPASMSATCFEDRASGSRDDRAGLAEGARLHAAGRLSGRLEARPARPLPAAPSDHGHRPQGTRGVAFRSLTEQIDTTTPQGEFLFHIFGALAQFERSLIQERVRPGLPPRAAGAAGAAGRRHRCRKARRSGRALDGGATKAAVCRTFGIKRSTLIDSLARIGWAPCRPHAGEA